MRLALIFFILTACSPSNDLADGGTLCRRGFLPTALGGCSLDPVHPPCECVRSIDNVFCCSGDVCCNDPSCGIGHPACVDGLITCGGFTTFISFESACDGDLGH